MARKRSSSPPLPPTAMTKTRAEKRPGPTQLATPPSSVEVDLDPMAVSKPRAAEKQIRRRPVPRPHRPQPLSAPPRPSTSQRNFSGDTLVDNAKDLSTLARQKNLDAQVESALDIDWEPGRLAENLVAQSADPRPKSAMSTSSKALETLSDAAGKLKSALGKRGRDAIDTGREALGLGAKRRESGRLRASVSATPDPIDHPGPSKRPVSDSFTGTTTHGSRRKRWLDSGLYLGQTDDSELFKTSAAKKFLPPPMYDSTSVIDFRLPFDIFSLQQKSRDVPREWRKLHANRFIDDAKDLWRRQRLAKSDCMCTSADGCGDGCLNRTMLYECDSNNCALGPEECSNRAFEDLGARMKKGGKFDHGIEIFRTVECGFGVRANRSFAPGQIIVEYCGEVITAEECDRRMTEEYKDKDCFYIMNFDQGMMIDATKGNIARFVNHACEPNCRMEKRIVKGEPRMALFAGPYGIMTGEELTYDYNFDNFSQFALDCRCGAQLCRGKLDRRDAKKDKETLAASLKRKAAELLSRESAPVEPTVIKKRKTARWSKGWSYIDPEMEVMRLQEDAIEKGKSVDAERLEALKALERPASRAEKRVDYIAKRKPGRVSGNLRPRPSRAIESAKTALSKAKSRVSKTVTGTTSSVQSRSSGDVKEIEATFQLPELDFDYRSESPVLWDKVPCLVVTNATGDGEDVRAASIDAGSTADDMIRTPEDERQGLLLSTEGDGKAKKEGGVKRSLSDAGKKIGSVVGRRKSTRRA